MNRFEKPFITMVNSVLPDRRKIMTENLAEDFFRDHITERTPLDPIINEIIQGIHRLPIHEYVLARKTPESDTEVAKERWGILKPSINALSSVFISDIWESFATERTALVKNNPALMPTNLAHLREKTESLFRTALQSWVSLREEKSQRRLQEVSDRTLAYRQFKAIFTYGYRNSLINRHDDLIDFIGRGIITSSRTTWGVIDLVPRVAAMQKIPLTKDLSIQTMHRAYGPIISFFASMNKELSIPILVRLRSKDAYQFDPAFFYRRDQANGYALKMRHRKLLTLRDEDGIPFFLKSMDTPTTWCPAKYALPGKENVIHGFVKWNIAVAERFFDGITALPDA